MQRGKVPHRPTYEVADGSQGGEVKRMLGPRIVSHGPDACINSKAASSYLNQPAVQKALNVQQHESESNGQTCWSVCGKYNTMPMFTCLFVLFQLVFACL